MANTRILQELSFHLRTLLLAGTSSNRSPLLKNNISLNSPVDFPDSSNPEVKLSLYLFHILQNEHLNNEPFLRIGNQQFRRPLFVDVHYLVTPVSKDAAENLDLMGQCIQIFSANSILRDPIFELAREPSQGEARLRMLMYDLDSMNKLWSALSKPYRMSVAYEVSSVPIEDVRPPQAGSPVEEFILDVQQMGEN